MVPCRLLGQSNTIFQHAVHDGVVQSKAALGVVILLPGQRHVVRLVRDRRYDIRSRRKEIHMGLADRLSAGRGQEQGGGPQLAMREGDG